MKPHNRKALDTWLDKVGDTLDADASGDPLEYRCYVNISGNDLRALLDIMADEVNIVLAPEVSDEEFFRVHNEMDWDGPSGRIYEACWEILDGYKPGTANPMRLEEVSYELSRFNIAEKMT